MSRIIGLAVAREKMAGMQLLNSGEISYREGLVGHHRGLRDPKTDGRRQVTILSKEQWLEACLELNACISWWDRRPNLFVSGMRFGPRDVDRRLFTEKGIVLEITGETTPCDRMDEIFPGLRNALAKDWRGGVTCRVLTGDLVSLNDRIVFL